MAMERECSLDAINSSSVSSSNNEQVSLVQYHYMRPVHVAKRIHAYYQCYELGMDVNTILLRNLPTVCINFVGPNILFVKEQMNKLVGKEQARKELEYFSYFVVRYLGASDYRSSTDYIKSKLRYDVETNPGPMYTFNHLTPEIVAHNLILYYDRLYLMVPGSESLCDIKDLAFNMMRDYEEVILAIQIMEDTTSQAFIIYGFFFGRIPEFLDDVDRVFWDYQYRMTAIKLMHDIETNPGPVFSKLTSKCVDGVTLLRMVLENKGLPQGWDEEYLAKVALDQEGKRDVLIHDVLKELDHVKPQGGWEFDPLKIGKLSESLKECVDKFQDTTNAGLNKVEGFVRETHRRMDQAGQTVNGVIGSIGSFIEQIINFISHPATGAISFMALYIILQLLEKKVESSLLRVAKMVVGFVGLTYIGKEFITSLVTPWLTTAPIPQSGFGDWMALAIEGISLATLGFKVNLSSATNFITSLGKLEQEASNLDKLITRVTEWLSKLVVALAGAVKIEISDWFLSNDATVKKLQQEVGSLMQEYLHAPMAINARFAERVTTLLMKVNELALRAPSGNNSVRAAIVKLQEQVTNLTRFVADAGIELGDRDEPTFVLISGAPGAGKTYFSDFVKQELITKMATCEAELEEIETNWKSQVYTWPLDAKHHDMYRGEWVVDFPDLFCKTDVAGTSDSEPMALIYLIGGQAMNLSAAELSKKQRLWMISRVVIACTNVTYVPDNLFESIRNVDALRRRLEECCFYMYPKPEYALRDATGKIVVDHSVKKVAGYENVDYLYAQIDRSKVPESPDGTMRNDIYHFRRQSMTTGKFLDGNIHTQESAMEHIFDVYYAKSRNAAKKRAMLKKTIVKLVAKRREELKQGAVPQARKAEEQVTADPEWVERSKAKGYNEVETYDTADEGELRAWRSLATGGSGFKRWERKKRESKPVPPKPTYAKVAETPPKVEPKPQAGEEEIVLAGEPLPPPEADWFSMTGDNSEVAKKLREKKVFLMQIKKLFSRETHMVLRSYYLLGAGVNNVTEYSQVSEEVMKANPITRARLAKFYRDCHSDHRVVFLMARMKKEHLASLAEMSYLEASNRIEYLLFCADYVNTKYADVMWCYYSFIDLFSPFYEILNEIYEKGTRIVKEYILDPIAKSEYFQRAYYTLRYYYPILEEIGFFIACLAFGHAVGVGVAYILGVPTNYEFLDKPRLDKQKTWNTGYVARLHGCEAAKYAFYSDYNEYKNADVTVIEEYMDVTEADGNVVHKFCKCLVLPYFKPKAQGSWKEKPTFADDQAKVTENTYLMYFEAHTKGAKKIYRRHSCNLVFLGCSTGVLVHHVRSGMGWLSEQDLSSYSNVVLVPFDSEMSPDDSPLKFPLDSIVFEVDKTLEGIDLVVAEFPGQGMKVHHRLEKMIPPKNCLDYIVSKTNLEGIFLQKPTKDLKPFGPVKPQDVYMNMSGLIRYNDVVELDRGELKGKYETQVYEYTSWSLKGRNATFVTYDGDCTSPCILTDPRKNICVNMGYKQAAQPWLCYLHTALHGSVPKGTYIYRELFQKYFDRMYANVTPIAERTERDLSKYAEVIAEVTGVTPQGALMELTVSHDQIDAVHYKTFDVVADLDLTARSNIKRSRVYGLDERKRVPARLTPWTDKELNVYHDVRATAEAPYGSNSTVLPLRQIPAVAQDVVTRMMNDSVYERNPEVLSLDQALLGDAGHMLKPIDFSTSAGMAFRLVAKKFGLVGKGKRFMQGTDGKLLPEFRTALEKLLDHAKGILASGDRFTNIYIDNLKDELILKEKVKAGKTRLFCSADFLYLILCRMYYGAFAGWNVRSRIHNGIAVGINVYSKEWDALYYRLKDHSDKHIFADYGKFDKKQKQILMRVCLLGIHSYYGVPEGSVDWLIREMLFLEIVNSVHLTERDGKLLIHVWDHGNTSGNFLTAILNSWVNILIVHLACVFAQQIEKGKDPRLCTPGDYDWEEIISNLKYITLGDDLIASVKGKLAHYFNFHVFKLMVEEYLGLEVTDELKTGDDVPPFRTLLEGSFLGRRFRPGRFRGIPKIYCPLRPYSVLEHVQWVRGVTDVDIEVAKFELTFIELSEYPRDYFDLKVPSYAEACYQEYGKYPRFTNYDVAQERATSLSCDRYAFETFYIEANNKESDFIKLGLLGDLTN